MNSVSRRRSRISLVAMIVGGLVAVAPVFGPLGKTLHYLSYFIAERPQPMTAPDVSFFTELLALIACLVGLIIFAISLLILFEVAGHPRRADDNVVRIYQSMNPTPKLLTHSMALVGNLVVSEIARH